MHRFFKILKSVLLLLLVLVMFTVTWFAYLYYAADMKQPRDKNLPDKLRLVDNGLYRQYGDNYLRKSESGLWELKIKGSAFERGVAAGKLMDSLLYYQEKVFVDQIRKMIPSENYLKFLRFFIVMFNRNLGKNVTEEYRDEIYGISLSCTDEYDFIGNPYERQLNYHAAHDIGHTMQDYMLVGCSSFATWDKHSADSSLIIGRNFDFYMGDDFARNKLVMFCEPAEGYKFASVGWPGMVGVLSGMNEEGLTVTINAAKSSIPTSAATPISLLVREILQYASTIDEAYAIVQKRQTFVSESILIGSAKDGRAAVIEKSPGRIGLFADFGGQIICTNHFQSDEFKEDKRNIENIQTTDSYYRYQRLEELLAEQEPVDEYKAVSMLRNNKGLSDSEVGLSNEMAINQFIAHHTVIFKPEQLIMWVSTNPWQSGKFVAYDLNKIFNAKPNFLDELYAKELTIPADSVFLTGDYNKLLKYRNTTSYIKQQMKVNKKVSTMVIEEYLASNPDYYHLYEILGNYYQYAGELAKAKQYYQQALTKAIPKVAEKERILKKLE
ncbi:MAG: C45 family autoproteolytic acyltransferase/hydrolase [Prevotellaceae bacterium]|jgi:hypothetical protein|nr:C45 family autoproteolytic acyltransferase/hydrolase [Prevotellaceae bacterium]